MNDIRRSQSRSALALILLLAGACEQTATSPDPTPAASQPAPAVSAVTPAVISSDGGTSIVVTGTEFTSVSAVRFGETAAWSFTVESDTTISVTAPGGSPGTGHLTVVTPGGTSVTSDMSLFTWDPNSLVDLTVSAPIVVPGTSLSGTVTVTYPAPGGGIRLPLTWQSTPPRSTAVLMPQTVFIPEGLASGSFQIVTFFVSTEEQIEVSSEHWGGRSATFRLKP